MTNVKISRFFGFLFLIGTIAASTLLTGETLRGQEKDKKDKGPAGERGSIVEDRNARKLLEAGDARLEGGEATKAVEVYQSVIERYPRSKVRFDAHLKLGNYLLTKERAFDRARTHFESAAGEDNSSEEQRAEAMLKIGTCYYEAANYGKCFKYMRDVIEKFPVSPQVNQAFYFIGLGHFKQGHYSRAIGALERVGTALPPPDPAATGAKSSSSAEILEAGKRLFVRVDDADLAALEPGKTVPVKVESTSGDVETVECFALGRNVRVVIGSIPTALGKPKPNNGRLEIKGGDKVKISYRDVHTAANKEAMVVKEIEVVGTAVAAIMDGAYAETLQGVVLGKGVNLQVIDADFDLTDGADIVKAVVEVYREKTPEELAADATAPGAQPAPAKSDPNKLERFKKIDKVDVILSEAKIVKAADTAAPPLEKKEEEPKADAPKKDDAKKDDAKKDAPKADEKKDEPKAEAKKDAPPPPPKPVEDDGTIHTGVFRGVVALEKSEQVNPNDQVLQAQPNDLIVLTYIDTKNSTGEPRTVTFKARTVEGSLGTVRVSQTQISDQDLRVRTQLKTASALTNIGNRYKEFGLKQHADTKYQQAMALCEEVSGEAAKLGGRTLEETYVQLWKIYFEMDKLDLAAAMSQRLQREFPNSEFVDAALLSLAQVARKQNQLQRAIGIYTSVLRLDKSPLRGEAQFGIAECYEDLAKAAGESSNTAAAAQLFDLSFQEYKKVYDKYPDSGRVGEAVSKMANYYYVQKDYARAIDVFETVLRAQPDAKFLDVILFNYGRCLYRLDKKSEARKQFDQLIADFPESALAADAKKISEALRKAGH